LRLLNNNLNLFILKGTLFEYNIIVVIRCCTVVMKKIALFTLLLLTVFKLSAFSTDRDSTEQHFPFANIIDSLQQQLKQATNDSLKAGIYTQIAAKYLDYDTISNKQTKRYYQEKALSYTLLALHGYSRYNDTAGLRTSFNNLSKVYRSQNKYPQAKWFILQSNTIAREQNDIPNIISSLNMGDLNEALKLATVNHYPKAESAIQQSYAILYSRLKDYTKEAIALKRHNYIEDSIKRVELAQLTAKLNARDSVQSKKKLNLISYRRTYKTSLSKRTTSI